MSAILAVYASHNLHCFLPLICFLSEKRHTPKLLLMKTAIQGYNQQMYIYIYSIFSIMNSVLISLKWSSNSKFPISSHFILPISFHYFPFVSMSWWWLSHLSPLSLQFPIENDLNSPIIVDKVPFFPPLELLWMHKNTELSSDPPSFSILIPLFIPCFPIFPQFFPIFLVFFFGARRPGRSRCSGNAPSRLSCRSCTWRNCSAWDFWESSMGKFHGRTC